jgi:hypothetical protein
VSETTIAPPPPAPADAPKSRGVAPISGLPDWQLAVLTGIVLLLISTAIVLWARTRPGFDPYGWLVWGQQTLKLALDTNAAPSWKPLPYLFTVPFAVAGHYQLWLWMITLVASALAGAVFAARIAYRLIGQNTDKRYPALIAGAFAAAGVLGIHNYAHFYLSSQSDPMIVTLVLGAIDCHLSRRYRWAFALWILASLGRPEAWLFTGLYVLWAWRAVPSMRWFLGAGVALTALLWFGIPAITSKSAFQAGNSALGSGRALHHNKILGTIDRFLDLQETPLELVALLSLAIAFYRRDRATLLIAAGTAAWVIVEIAFDLHGWPGNGRYMFPAAGALAVVAAVAIGRLLADPPSLRTATGVGGAILAAVVIGALIPPAISHARAEHRDLKDQRLRTKEINRLTGTISKLGGAALIRRCGEPLTRLEYQSILAWNLRVNVSSVGFKYGKAIARRQPIVLFTPKGDGWKVQALYQRLPACRALPH